MNGNYLKTVALAAATLFRNAASALWADGAPIKRAAPSRGEARKATADVRAERARTVPTSFPNAFGNYYWRGRPRRPELRPLTARQRFHLLAGAYLERRRPYRFPSAA